MISVNIKQLSDKAITPVQNIGDCGYDLFSTEDKVLQYGERYLFKTDIALSIPRGYYGRICDRSGKALKDGLHVLAGQIDSTYRGNIGVILINLKKEFKPVDGFRMMVNDKGERVKEELVSFDVEIKKGDKIAQIVFEQYHEVYFNQTDELGQTIRNTNGYGSTGR